MDTETSDKQYRENGMVPPYSPKEKETILLLMNVLKGQSLTFGQAHKVLAAAGDELLNRTI